MLFIKGFSLNKDVAVIISGNINKDIKVLIPDIFDGNCNKYRYWIVQVNMYIGFYIEQFIFEIEKVLQVITLLQGLAWDQIKLFFDNYMITKNTIGSVIVNAFKVI